jgi:hypothetical protein
MHAINAAPESAIVFMVMAWLLPYSSPAQKQNQTHKMGSFVSLIEIESY